MKRSKEEEHTRELVELASKFELRDVGYGREEDGTLPGWKEWAAAHPQRHHDVNVCHGREEWNTALMDTIKENMFSLVSWNILSDTWYQKERHTDFAHTADHHGSWEGRFPLFCQWVQDLKPHILSLQEVDFDLFDSDILPALSALGYKGRMQGRKKQCSKQPCGVATFWKRDKFHICQTPEGQECITSFSRSMVLVLSLVEEPSTKVCFVNVHLESSQSESGAEKRARQLNSPLLWAAKRDDVCSLVVCGDCNTGADSALFQVLRTKRWHGHAMTAVFEHPHTASAMPVNRATFLFPNHHYVIDHVLYTHESLHLKHALSAFSREECKEHVGEGFDKGFPGALCPSDHIPVGAVFEIDTKAHTCVTSQLALHELTPERQDELVAEWENLQSQKPPHRKGKPTPEEIEERQAFKAKLTEWKDALADEKAAFEFASGLEKGKIKV